VLPVRGAEVRGMQDVLGKEGDPVAAAGGGSRLAPVRVPHVRRQDGPAEVQQLRGAGVRVSVRAGHRACVCRVHGREARPSPRRSAAWR